LLILIIIIIQILSSHKVVTLEAYVIHCQWR